MYNVWVLFMYEKIVKMVTSIIVLKGYQAQIFTSTITTIQKSWKKLKKGISNNNNSTN